jgi:dGTPase
MQRALAPYATQWAQNRGRRFAEPDSPTRTPFQRDRDRIVHSAAFRRLQYKTQVFVYHEGDHYRTRLTHSLEVAQIARSVCRVLGLDEDLAEAVALAHDLGHTPFGHAGEDALDEATKPWGGFDHNAQTLRIVTALEHRYAGFDGLNLTWECLEGVVKHNGPLKAPIPAIRAYSAEHDLELDTYAGAEAQVAALADDIAYNHHDIDDGLRAGLFDIPEVLDLPLVGPVFRAVERAHPGLERARLIHEAVRELIGRMVQDLIDESARRLTKLKPDSAAALRALGEPAIGFSAEMQAHDQTLKAFLRRHMYRHYKVNRMTSKARRVVRELFGLYLAEPECLPPEWSARTDGAGIARTARLAADFIAGMTDRFALEEHSRLFDPTIRSA